MTSTTAFGRRVSIAAAILLVVALTTTVGTAQATLTQIGLGSLIYDSTIDFETTALGIHNSTIVPSGAMSFSERFAGQTLSHFDNFDVLSGTPSGPLTLVDGAANRNLNIHAFGGTGSRVLTGLGTEGANNNGRGKGAVSVLFGALQSDFGFQVVGQDGGTGTLAAFRADGSSVGSLTFGLGSTATDFAFSSGTDLIAGFSLTNFNGGGAAFDNFRYREGGYSAIPEPSTALLLGLGIAVAGFVKRRRAA